MPYSEKNTFPKRDQTAGSLLDSGGRQTEKGSEGVWDAAQSDHHLARLGSGAPLPLTLFAQGRQLRMLAA